MNFVIPRIAFRNLSRQKKRSLLLGSAIAFGIMIVTLMNGFSGALIQNISENFAYLMAGHVFIQGQERTASGKKVSVISDDSEIMQALKSSGVQYAQATRTSEISASLIFEGKTVRQTLTGIEMDTNPFLRQRLVLKQGSWASVSQPDALILTEKVAKKLKVQIGDKIIASLQTVTGQNNIADFTLVGISTDTDLATSTMAYVNLGYLNQAIGLKPNEYMSLGLMLDDMRQATPAADKILVALKSEGLQTFPRGATDGTGNQTPFQVLLQNQNEETWSGVKYRVYTIDDLMSSAKSIVTALDTATFIVLIILFAIIMIGINNTFRMTMYERIKEIGTMRAIGVQRNEVRWLFLFEALFLALGGIVAGLGLGYIVMNLLSLINFGTNSPAFLLLKNGHLSFYLPPLRALLNIGTIVVLTLLAALFPANSAAKLEPAVALRSTK